MVKGKRGLYSSHVKLHASTPVRVLKIPNMAAIPLFGHMDILHTLVGVGGAALAAAVPCPGKAIEISPQGSKEKHSISSCK